MKKMKQWLCVVTALLILCPVSSPVYAAETGNTNEDRTGSPYFLIENGDPQWDRIPLKDTKVSVNISGIIAETYVTQTYTNEGEKPINASYIFPASTKVTVHGLKMTIGNQVVTASIQKKEEARETFEQAKSEGKSASLMEEQRPNVFSMDVANIMPGDTICIELHYSELIGSTDNTWQFVFPTVVGPRYVGQAEGTDTQELEWVEMPYLPEGSTAPGTYDITVHLSAGVPLSSLHCNTHDTNVVWTDTSTARISLANPQDYAGNRDYILEYRLTGEQITGGLMLDSGEEENFFLLTVQPPERYESQDILPREYIFVLDVSGSMSGFPLDTAKELIRNLITNIKESDSFNLILFSDTDTMLSPKPIPATEENIKKAIRLIDWENGGGGTELAPALRKAAFMKKGTAAENLSRNIIVITDGYVFGESEIFELIRNITSADFFSFGIGSAVNRYLIEGISKTGLGESFIVTDPAEAADTAERFRTYVQSPILTDVAVDFGEFDAYEVEPRKLPTLYANKPLVLFGKWRGEATGTITITGKTGNQDYTQQIPLEQIQPKSSGSLRYLWARTRIDRLTDYGANENNPEIKDEVTALGLHYSILTPYTSFVAVLETIRNPEGESIDTKQPNPLPLHVSNLAVGYTIGSEPGDVILLAGIIVLLGTGFLTRRQKKTGKSSLRKGVLL